MFDSTTKIQRKDDQLLSSPLADEIVMMNVKTGDYLGLNGVATSIWNLLEKPITIDEICHELLEEYEIDKATCAEKTIEFLIKLKEDNLIIIHN